MITRGNKPPHVIGFVKAAYSVNETLTLLSIGRTSLYRLVKCGELRPGKLGKKTLFYASDLAALLERIRQPLSRQEHAPEKESE
jgi:excisionase family DNA binding protein